MPDIWKPRFHLSSGVEAQPALAFATAACGDKNAGQELLPFVSATAAVVTLHDFGCWLLQHHKILRHLQIGTTKPREDGWNAEWKLQAGFDSSTISSRGNSTETVECRIPKCCIDSRDNLDHQPQRHSSPEDISAISEALLAEFSRNLSQYSARPATDALRHIISCHMNLTHVEVKGLAGFLTDLKSLKHLKVRRLRSEILPMGPGLLARTAQCPFWVALPRHVLTRAAAVLQATANMSVVLLDFRRWCTRLFA